MLTVLATDLPDTTVRIYRNMAALGLAGTLVGFFRFGGAFALGFFVGAAFSAVNFWFWHRLVRKLGAEPEDPDRPRQAPTVMFGMRYLLFGLGGYAILNYFEASLLAALAGIFVAVAAVILEILFELIYGTS